MKIFNDPVHGFIEVRSDLMLHLLDHAWVQRLRRIKQMGASSLVYPGAEHTRLNHALGAYHLATEALDTLLAEGVLLTDAEREATLIAVLLHDLGHGPFSHALEGLLLPGHSHEAIGLELQRRLSRDFGGALDLSLSITTGRYPRPFLHELVSSQLDVDRLDYLLRDSFFTGVAEGVIGADRILKTLSVEDEHLVVHEKGLHSVEKFLVARRLMYWQVYFHKTAQAAESLLQRILLLARTQLAAGQTVTASPPLLAVLSRTPDDPIDDALLEQFVLLDDHDVLAALKAWALGPQSLLADLCQRWLNRRLPKLHYYSPDTALAEHHARLLTAAERQWGADAAPYYVFSGSVSNRTYGGAALDSEIRIRLKRGGSVRFSDVSELATWQSLLQPRERHYLCAPAETWAAAGL
jgi:uncharacterized protein